MSLRPELRHLYGAAHRAYRAELIALLGPRCTRCGREMQKYLNLAHVTHDPRAASMTTLWCPACHARNDAKHRLAVMRRTHATRVGQAWLWPEVEWAVFASWMIPAKVRREAQEVLF